jgi:hypothetical protein
MRQGKRTRGKVLLITSDKVDILARDTRGAGDDATGRERIQITRRGKGEFVGLLAVAPHMVGGLYKLNPG